MLTTEVSVSASESEVKKVLAKEKMGNPLKYNSVYLRGEKSHRIDCCALLHKHQKLM